MQNSFLTVGTKVEINSKRRDVKFYMSQIEDILEENLIRISAPIYARKVVPMPIGSRYTFTLLTPLGCFENIGEVRALKKDKNIFYVDLEVVDEYKRVQRRDYFRFDCLLQMKYSIVEVPELKEDDIEEIERINSNKLFEGVAKDISGGGLRFAGNEEIKKGSIIECFVDVKDGIVNMEAEVLTKVTINTGSYLYEYRIRYKQISAADREKIIKYIFDEQRRSMRKAK